MKLGTMLGDVTRSFFIKPVTERYPFIKNPAPKRLRGQLHYDPSKCSGCQLCIKDCPSNAIELITVDKVAKRFVLRYHSDRCTFCAQCVQNCKFKCIEMSNEEWELASTNKIPFEIYYGREEDVAFLLEKASHPGTGA
jgi:formate hydrogenlyase subunit 6/NADH:ubiquinone oxidoreductase subunit I